MMMQWGVMFRKELLEMWRNYKWIWVPLVFILLGIMQPVVMYYMPQIIESAGGLPSGSVIEIPLPSPGEVLAETLGQFNTLGLLILALAFMGIISAERASGVAGLILVKPVSYAAYVSAKWAAAMVLTAVSGIAGTLAAWYYTVQLIGDLSLSVVIASLGLFLLWLAFVVTLTVFFSALMKSQGAVAFLTLLTVTGITLLTSLFSKVMKYSPSKLAEYAGNIFMTDPAPSSMWLSIGVTVLCTCALIALSSVVFRGKELVG